MLTKDLLERVRARLRDITSVPNLRLWSSEELIDDYGNIARDRLFLAVRRLLVDSVTAYDFASPPNALCQFAVSANTGSYAISPSIIEIVRIQLASQPHELKLKTMADLDREVYNWRHADAGVPWCYVPDADTDHIILFPTPNKADVANLTVGRFPLTLLAVARPNDDLGFRREYHPVLIDGILAQALGKKDAETDRPELAAFYEKKFVERIDEIKLEVLRRFQGPQTSRPHRAFLAR